MEQQYTQSPDLERAGIFVNPGTGPIEGTKAQAVHAMEVFITDLAERNIEIVDIDYAGVTKDSTGLMEGYFSWTLTTADGRELEVDMPGLPLERLRFLDTEEQNIWDFQRLYVNGSSWVWKFALGVCRPDDEE